MIKYKPHSLAGSTDAHDYNGHNKYTSKPIVHSGVHDVRKVIMSLSITKPDLTQRSYFRVRRRHSTNHLIQYLYPCAVHLNTWVHYKYIRNIPRMISIIIPVTGATL